MHIDSVHLSVSVNEEFAVSKGTMEQGDEELPARFKSNHAKPP